MVALYRHIFYTAFTCYNIFTIIYPFSWKLAQFYYRERSGSVVECLTRDRGVAGLSLTGITALWSLSKTHLS